MSAEEHKKKEALQDKIVHFTLPRYEELPDFDLYMEQLIDLLDKYLADFYVPGEEKTLTSTMVNNYVKNKVISPPKNKKYNKDQLMYLIVVGILKQVFCIQDIAQIFELQTEQYSTQVAYNYFCVELENALKAAFSTRDFSKGNSATKITPLSEVTRSALLSFANKIYVKKKLHCEK